MQTDFGQIYPILYETPINTPSSTLHITHTTSKIQKVEPPSDAAPTLSENISEKQNTMKANILPNPPNRNPPSIPVISTFMSSPLDDDSQYEEAENGSHSNYHSYGPTTEPMMHLLTHSGNKQTDYQNTTNDLQAPSYQPLPSAYLRKTQLGAYYIPSTKSTETSTSTLSPQSNRYEKTCIGFISGPNLTHKIMSTTPHFTTTTNFDIPTSQSPLMYSTESTGTSYSTDHHYKVNQNNYFPPLQIQSNGSTKRKTKKKGINFREIAIALAIALVATIGLIIYLLLTDKSSNSFVVYDPAMHSIYARKNHKDFPLRGSLVFPLPHAFSLGEEVTADLPPGRIVYTQFHVSKPSTINFNISIGSRAKVVLYLRETALPTPAVNDFRRVILADRLHLVSGKRSVDRSNLRSTLFSYLLLAGKWNLAFLNDGDQLQPLTLIATVSGQFNGPFEAPSFDVSPLLTDSDTCKFDCSNKGKCKGGKCECFPGYDGFYCETSSCPILCSGNGVYLNGQCMCHDNYKGPECDIPSSWCSVPDCNGHGECGRNGKCSCRSGWSGEYCDQKTCVNGCSNNGICSSEGKCYCSNGYFGETCHKSIRDLGSDKVNKTVYKSDPKPVQIIPTEPSTTKNKFCSERGVYESSFGTCKCDKGFKGNYCEILGCTVDCGVHGTCVDGNTCQCHDDYEGDFCEKKSCLPTCHLNGVCQEDGSCQCNNGFNGEDCSIEGCPQSCHGNGNCEKVNSVWTCICDKDHQGSENCQFRFGEVCDDGLDNDNDGLIDCEDSTECCGHPSCASESLCNNIPKPSELAVRSNKSGMSFYEQYKFLIAPNSVQYYVKEQSFVEKRVSVVRGRVFSIKAGPLSGVRVSEESNGYSGFTLTRTKNETGYFDILVNGGGIISLRFMRPQFARTYKNVYVGINEVVYIGDVYLDESQNQKAAPTKECKDYLKHHDISPIIIPYWSLSQYSAYPPNHSNPVLFAESLSILDSIALQGSTDLKLVYYSDRTPTSFSHIFLQLIDSQTPVNIKNVHVKTTVAGTTYQTTLQAKPNLRYTFNWNKQDSYKQAVYGFVGINIDVGYEYKDCPVIVWTNSSHLIEGHQLSNLTMGGWQLSNHHHYDYLNNILERGDGKRLQLGEDERMVENFVGNENQRESKCFFCNSQKIEEALFYEPREIVFSKDGTLLIGDHNLIRMINFETGIISPILELPNTEADHSYFLAADPLSGTLIVSIPYKRQVIQISEFEEEMDLKKLVSNFDVLAGNGNSCAPEDPCGDYSDPKSAQLTFPKGVAVDGNGRKFVIDSRKLRSISKDGESIKTLISEKPIHPGKSNCRVAFDFEEVAFDWPTSIAIDYKSGFLFVLDVEIIYKLDLVNEVAYVYAGCRKECCGVANNNVLLLSARSIAVSEKENRLFVSEGDGKKVNQIRSFSLNYDTAKAIDLVVGKEGKCDCDKKNCPCDDKFATSASQAGLNNPSGIAFDLSGQMFIADQGNFKIKILRQFKPSFDKKKQVYKVNYPELNEMYTFDVNGQHLSTTSINTAKPIYTFKYLDSKLSQIELPGRKAIEISYNKEEILLEAPSNFKTKLELKDKCLVSVTNPDKTIINLRYSSQGQLIKKKANEKTWTFNYDSITNTPLSIISPAGQNYSVSDQILTSNGFSTNVLLNGQLFTTILVSNDNVLQHTDASTNLIKFKDGFNLNGGSTSSQFEHRSHPLLVGNERVASKKRTTLSEKNSSKLEWRSFIKRGTINRQDAEVVGRRLKVN